MNRKNLALGTAALCGLLLAATAKATVIADYQNDFRTNGTPAPGWSYLWNASAPIGNSANYVPLVHDTNFGGDYETQANGMWPDAPPGSSLAATSNTLYPGQGSLQASDGIPRYVIAAYTVRPSDIVAAGGGEASLPHYHFTVALTSLDGIDSRIYVNNTLIVDQILPPGLDYSDTLPGAYPVPLGNLKAGDTVYVAIGSRDADTGNALGVEYSIDLVPEPASAGLLMAGLLLIGRRRHRV